MPNLHINYASEFSKYVVDKELLPSKSFIVFDCGARGGLEKYWDVLGYTLQAVAFEPDSKECKKLNKIKKNINNKF